MSFKNDNVIMPLLENILGLGSSAFLISSSTTSLTSSLFLLLSFKQLQLILASAKAL